MANGRVIVIAIFMPRPMSRANSVARKPGWSVVTVTPLLDATERA
jgi:hypothetical protein